MQALGLLRSVFINFGSCVTLDRFPQDATRPRSIENIVTIVASHCAIRSMPPHPDVVRVSESFCPPLRNQLVGQRRSFINLLSLLFFTDTRLGSPQDRSNQGNTDEIAPCSMIKGRQNRIRGTTMQRLFAAALAVTCVVGSTPSFARASFTRGPGFAHRCRRRTTITIN
jgi:hypothetical protein